MSLHSNWVALTTVDIPWKSFVKESTEVPSKSAKKFPGRLNFQGIEAKKTYEGIICQNFKPDTLAKSDIAPEQQSNLLKSSNSLFTQKVITNVSTNSILKAVEQNDLHFLRKHLNSDNVNVSDDFGWTPLMSAAYNGNFEIVQYLLKLGVNKKAKEKSGLTAAQLALKRNHLNIVALLRKKNSQKDPEDIKSSPTLSHDKSDIVSLRDDERGKITKIEGSFKNELQSIQQNANNVKVEFYCEICKTAFKETSVKQHESSTLHIFNTKPKLRCVAYGIAKQNKGYQMLLNTGWDEETGLGPSGQGAKYPIKTILKRDRKGLGQGDNKEARITHFKPEDVSAVSPVRIIRPKTLRKKDREKLLSREAMKDRMIRIALS
ncbi:G patch domain and ankyrin repeat-containing protein 1 homolog [Neodiprion virginianus]|uniref:G patch domain and ankyrin repeat-containing protein 1 homolog n=1 Tax=Neodiprion virginianus TaxID=2961670 RepID=UPI001EE75C7A|nr:G patch domain and ankyrin repeat-containing protein 1 homolog [Neodiprion virginianus]